MTELQLGLDSEGDQWYCPTCGQTYPAHAHENVRNCTNHWPFTPMKRRQAEGVHPVTPLAPRARRTDPQTSHDAARSVDLRGSHEAVLDVMRSLGGECTDEELVDAYDGCIVKLALPMQSASGIRTRRKELADMDPPRVVDTGHKRKLKSGRSAIVWRVA